MLRVVNYDNFITIFPNFVGKHFQKFISQTKIIGVEE